MVGAFAKKFNQPRNKAFDVIGESEFMFRSRLLTEENKEYYDACLSKDKVKIADSLADMMYVLVGTCIAHGITMDQMERLFDEVHASNMTKTHSSTNQKLVKGSAYVEPEILLALNGWKRKKNIVSLNPEKSYGYLLEKVQSENDPKTLEFRKSFLTTHGTVWLMLLDYYAKTGNKYVERLLKYRVLKNVNSVEKQSELSESVISDKAPQNEPKNNLHAVGDQHLEDVTNIHSLS